VGGNQPTFSKGESVPDHQHKASPEPAPARKAGKMDRRKVCNCTKVQHCTGALICVVSATKVQYAVLGASAANACNNRPLACVLFERLTNQRGLAL
jgi:hypothetical protein